MRKIVSKYTENKRKKRNGLIVGMILIFIMFFSVIAYSLGGREDKGVEKIKYNGFEFIKQEGFWFTSIGNLDFVFKYNPKEVEKISSELNYLNDYSGKPLYLSSEYNEANSEIYRNLNQIVQRMQNACLEGEDYEGDFPIKTCENNFIIIKESNVTEIIQNKSCVFIQGPEENLTQITDEFLFKILGIR